MLNILTHMPTAAEIATVLTQLDTAALLPSAGDARWAEIGERAPLQPWKDALRARAEAHRGENPPMLTGELYALFQRDGSRLPFERTYFERRAWLAEALLCALLFPHQEQWHAETVRLARDIMDEESWALPAHIGVASGKDPMRIDLFSAETADTLATIIILLGDSLPSDLQEHIRARVRTQITDNFLENYDDPGSPSAHWTNSSANWNAVCHQGVVGAALALEQDTDRVTRILSQATRGLRIFVDGFGADGGSNEGPGYWNYGFGRFAWLNEQLETYSHGALSLVDGDPHVREIAAFARRLCVDGTQCIPFADCGSHTLPDAPLSAYLGARLNDPASMAQAQVSYARHLAAPGVSRQFDMLRLARYCPAEINPDAQAQTQDWFFADLQVLVAAGTDDSGRRAVFAAKGGSNAEHHNHNDAGSFAYYLDGTPFAIEIGAPEYVKAFFGPERYSFFAARSQGHSVPLINDCEQAAGGRHAATVGRVEMEKAQAGFTLDITRAYPDSAECASAVRAFLFDKRTLSLRVTDTFTLNISHVLETAFITDAEVALLPNGTVRLEQNGARMHLTPGPGTRLLSPQTHTFSGHDGHLRTVSRLALVPNNLVSNITLVYTLQPE